MAWLARSTPHRLSLILASILILAVAMPDLASGKHKRPKNRISTAEFVAGFGDPSGWDIPTPFFTSPHSFKCSWEEVVHDYLCTPRPTNPVSAEQWPDPFPLAHALGRSGPGPDDPAPPRFWGGLSPPDIAREFSCLWDGTLVPPGGSLASHYGCNYRNPQLHTFTVAEIVSVCENETLVPLECQDPNPPPLPPYSHDEFGSIDPWYLPDTMPPETAVTAGPPALAPGEAAFEFTSSEDGSSFECRLDDGAWEECAPPQEYTELGSGRHSFEVRATDAAINLDLTPGGWAWQVDATAPETTIIRGPRETTRDRTPRFVLSASEPFATFECRLDTEPSRVCTTPHTVLRRLADGKHTFSVSAIDMVGNTDESPALRSFTLDTAGPRVQISGRRVFFTRRGRVTVRVRCPTSELSGLCAGKLSLKTVRAVQIGTRPRRATLGRKNFKLARGRGGVVALQLSRGVLGRVVQFERLKVRATVRARDRLGNVATTSKRLLLAPRR